MAKILMDAKLRGIEWPLTLAGWHAQGLSLVFAAGGVDFRSFQESDTLALLEIRNDPGVLPFMPSQEPLPLERHRAWVGAHLLGGGAAAPLVAVGRQAGVAVGFGLIKPTGDAAVFEIGVMVTGPWQGRGLPARLATALAVTAGHVFGAHELLTHVHPSHERALRFNRAWGLRESASGKPGELCFRAPIEQLLSTPLCLRSTRDLTLRVIPRE